MDWEGKGDVDVLFVLREGGGEGREGEERGIGIACG